MPLPPALQARLQKRGIIDESGNLSDLSSASAPPKFAVPSKNSALSLPPTGAVAASLNYAAVHELEAKTSCPGCPNKVNPYHVCTEFCRLRWRNGFGEPEKYTEKKRQLMLLKYPKPPGWKEIYDPGTGRHYYWNVDSDEVSWFPPEHPKASITISANRLRAILMKTNFKPTAEVAKYLYRNASCITTLITDETEENPQSMTADDALRQRFEKQYGSVAQRSSGGGKAPRYKPREDDALDPMDPAAYCDDVSRGGWGVGLDTRDDAKTGVDVTASGPLFQSRPYPSPGAILRKNAASTGKKN